jgi:pimeloyl-ACP methyl ester carboxylesterase
VRGVAGVVLQHGFTSCLEYWYQCGYVGALRSKYRLILIDPRGHGDSDKPHDEESYTLDHRVADMTTVLDALGIGRSHFWGNLMGDIRSYDSVYKTADRKYDKQKKVRAGA